MKLSTTLLAFLCVVGYCTGIDEYAANNQLYMDEMDSSWHGRQNRQECPNCPAYSELECPNCLHSSGGCPNCPYSSSGCPDCQYSIDEECPECSLSMTECAECSKCPQGKICRCSNGKYFRKGKCCCCCQKQSNKKKNKATLLGWDDNQLAAINDEIELIKEDVNLDFYEDEEVTAEIRSLLPRLKLEGHIYRRDGVLYVCRGEGSKRRCYRVTTR